MYQTYIHHKVVWYVLLYICMFYCMVCNMSTNVLWRSVVLTHKRTMAHYKYCYHQTMYSPPLSLFPVGREDILTYHSARFIIPLF